VTHFRPLALALLRQLKFLPLSWLVSFVFAQGIDPQSRFEAAGDIVVRHKFELSPSWSGGALVSLEYFSSDLPIVRVFDADGQPKTVVEVKIPGADHFMIKGAAHGADGTVAICGTAKDAQQHFGFLALASGDGAIRTIVRTEPYVPNGITIAPDGTIWTKGCEYGGPQKAPAGTNRGIIRQFDASGKLLAEYLPQSSLSRVEVSGGPGDRLAANSKRIGWYMGSFAKAYFEIVRGEVERYPTISTESTDAQGAVYGLTIMDDDQVFATRVTEGPGPLLYTLDRQSRSWKLVTLPGGGEPPATRWLLGGTGNILVFGTTEGLTRLRRFKVRAP
jgi:hypothetical protein